MILVVGIAVKRRRVPVIIVIVVRGEIGIEVARIVIIRIILARTMNRCIGMGIGSCVVDLIVFVRIIGRHSGNGGDIAIIVRHSVRRVARGHLISWRWSL